MNNSANEPLLAVSELKKYFPIRGGVFSRTRAEVRAVEEVNFSVHRGEVLGIVGESGCGKTTVGRLILRLIEPTAGRVVFDGNDVFSLKKETMRRLRREMTVVFQDPYASLDPRMNIGRIVSEPIKIHNLCQNREETKARTADVLERVGIRPEHIKRHPHEFSGGQRQRIAIARTLVLEPKLVIADEPVSALDVSIQAQVLNLLMDLRKEFHLTYLFIAHDLQVVRYVSHRVAVMYLGRVVELADRDAVYDNPMHPYTEALLAAAPVPDPNSGKRRIVLRGDVPSPIDPPPGCVFHQRCPYRKDDCSRVVPEFREIAENRFIACHFPIGDL